jgi:HSP20 family protein
VPSEQIELSVAGRELSIEVKRAESERQGVTYHRHERPVGDFARTLQLPAEIESAGVQAELRDGVLTVTLPKAQASRPRKVSVVAAS